MFKKTLLASQVLMALSFSVSLSAEEFQVAEAPAEYATCVACHGVNGVAVIPGYPNLAGQNKQYIINAYNAYKNGERHGGNAEIMKAMSGVLATEEQVEAVADWLSKQKQ